MYCPLRLLCSVMCCSIICRVLPSSILYCPAYHPTPYTANLSLGEPPPPDAHSPTGTIDSGMPSAATLGLPTFQADSSPTMLLPPSASIRPPPLVPTHPTALPPAPTTNPLAGFPDIPTIPPKLLDTILSWQYTDLSELLPDQLRSSSSTTDQQIVLFPQRSWESQKKRKRQIIDIATWVQLYSTYILILSSRHPQALPELIAYQLFIVKAAKKFRYPSWLYYDTEYQKWAAATHCQEWSTINTQLYSLAFTEQGNPVSWCPICQVDGGNHTFDWLCYIGT